MGEDLISNIPSPDAGETGACRSVLARADSVTSSLTVDTSKDDAAPGQCVEWTDKRHSLYLDSLEASFVKQLHSSRGLLGWRSRGDMRVSNSSREMPAKIHNSSDQFTVFRDGCQQKISFQRNQPLLDCGAVNSHGSRKGPWISRLRSADRHHMSTSSSFQKHISEGSQLRGNLTSSHGLARGSDQKRHAVHSYHQDLVGSTTEVSDQNFVDRDQGEESSYTSKAKRLKTDAVDSSSNDQIVPNGKFDSEGIATGTSSKLLSEDPEKAEYPESGVHFFLRER